MFVDALFAGPSLIVLAVLITMAVLAWKWVSAGQAAAQKLDGALAVLRQLASQLPDSHPVRKRVESAPVVELAFEEIAQIMGASKKGKEGVDGLLKLQDLSLWIERFAQFAVQIGILGTVFSLVSSDPTDLDSFRAGLPIALGTTFWGLPRFWPRPP